MKRSPGFTLAAAALLWGAIPAAICFGGGPASAPVSSAFAFTDVTARCGLLPDVSGIRGHAAAWGDIDNSGYPSLFVGAFHQETSKPSMLLRNAAGKFTLDTQASTRVSGCTSGAVFVDLANSGRLDLYVANNVHATDGAKGLPSVLLRNDGGGKLSDVSKESGACPGGMQGRSVVALDYDGDGLLDLLVCDFYYSTRAAFGVALFHNMGDYKFEEVGAKAGLPHGSAIAGAAAADLNNDGWPDVFLTSPDGKNRLFFNDKKGHFVEAPGAVFEWKKLGKEDPPTGVCIADVNRDGQPDIVVGHHVKRPWGTPVPVRLYLHRGLKDGQPVFEDATGASGLEPLEMKAPHIELQDFDNDGLPDLFVSIVKLKDGKPFPVIYRNMGVTNGVPQFRQDAWGVNDFPTAEDKAVRNSGAFYNKMLADKKIMYAAAAPTADFDRDGRLDIFLANWWIESNSLLLKNETKSGHFLDVQVRGAGGVNRMGIGAKVSIYPAGKAGDASALIGTREIAVGYGWCSGQEAVVHFGLGSVETVDMEVMLPHGKGKLSLKNVKADQRLTVARDGDAK